MLFIRKEIMEETMLEQGLTVTIMGVATVFLFLCILIFAMVIMYKCLTVINKFFPEVAVVAAPVKKASTASNDEEIAIALAATKAL